MGYPFDEESLMFTVFNSPAWKQLEAYEDTLPWFSDDPAVETKFTFLDKMNAAARAYAQSPAGQEERRRGEAMSEIAAEAGRSVAAVIDHEILSVLGVVGDGI